jgi:hypothetical protein
MARAFLLDLHQARPSKLCLCDVREVCLKLAAIIGAAFILAASAAAQQPAPQTAFRPARTGEGHVDFHGVWTQRWIAPLERPQGANALVVEAKDAPAMKKLLLERLEAGDPLQAPDDWDPLELLNVRGEFRSSLIVAPADGLLPYTAEGKARRAAFLPNRQRGADDPEQRGDNERCLGFATGHAPHMSAPIANIRQIVQTKDHLVIFSEHYHITRIIPFGDEAPRLGSKHGRAKARWDGDTLVVESTGFRPDDGERFVPLSVMLISPETKLTERFTRISADEILYRFTVEDPLLYTQAWSAETVMRRSPDRMYEYACHEGNYGLPNILRGGRAMERRSAKGGGL